MSILMHDNTSMELINAYKKLALQNEDRELLAAELIIANKELAFQHAEKVKRAEELAIANKDLVIQNEEKEKRAEELIIANRELVLQHTEKEKRAAELAIANKELAFQNEEKEKRATELFIANTELVFQNIEREQRANELVIANKELGFQNAEKEKRAAELIVANTELVFQNKEKEKRAAELIIANRELVFQNNEKEKRANELVTANKELVFQNTEKEKRAAELIAANEKLAVQNIEKGNMAAELLVANDGLAARTSELLAANKELESFSYSVSHDLRIPLRAIQGYSRMLQEDYESKLEPEARRLIDNIVNYTKKMGQLIDELLTFSRLGRKELVLVNVSMQNIVENICMEIENEHSDHKIEFKINELLPAKGDNVTLKQTWINLISNAVKYSSLQENPIIEIGSLAEEGEIHYYIKDNGAGFDMRYADKLFGVFQRLHNEDQFEGTGVGLAIVHRIICKHGGRVWGEGVVGKGATFRFALPRK
jgi:signal transduction histidine kinase